MFLWDVTKDSFSPLQSICVFAESKWLQLAKNFSVSLLYGFIYVFVVSMVKDLFNVSRFVLIHSLKRVSFAIKAVQTLFTSVTLFLSVQQQKQDL